MPAPKINPLVLDLSHHNTIDVANRGFEAAKAFGIRGVIHKASQGVGMVDFTYAPRRSLALAAGLLWGAYHFFEDAPVEAQVTNFLNAAKPDAATLVAIDHERSPRAPTVAELEQMSNFIQTKLNRRPVIYYGELLKSQLGSRVDAFLAQHRSWLSHYNARWVSQASWPAPWLWQFTDGKLGPPPHAVPGIAPGGIDINSFAGTQEELATQWAS